MAIAEPIVTSPIADIAASPESPNREISLFATFDDPFTTGLVARFELFDTRLGSNGGVTDVVLFDQAGAGAPGTVANFRNYVEDGDYINSIIHRSVPGFVVQGGGFIVDGLDEIVAENGNPANAVSLVPTDAPIANEFSPERSNLAGTIAMAKLGGDPDSATSQWFFNLGDNSSNLDNQNGGFTVFGEVRSEADFSTAEAIAALPTADGSSIFGQSAFTDLPFIDPNPETPDLEITGDANFVRYSNIRVFEAPELSFEVVGNSNPAVVNASIDGDRLVLDYANNATGTAEIVVRATNLLGETVDDTFTVLTEALSVESAIFPTLNVASVESGTVVGVLSASDRDPNETLSYAITDGDSGGAFAIAEDGTLSLADPEQLTQSFELNVTVSNSLGETATAAIAIPVNASGNDAPLVQIFDTDVEISETAANGSEVEVEVNIVDPDGNAATNIDRVEIIEGNADTDSDGTPAFSIDNSGAIAVADSDDLVAGDLFNLAIAATDTDGATDSDTVAIAITSGFNLDLDGDGQATAFNDGLILFRYLGGLAPTTFTSALANDATRSISEIEALLSEAENAGQLDFDGNAQATAFNDGLIGFRFLGGLAPSTFTSALSPNAALGIDEIESILIDLAV